GLRAERAGGDCRHDGWTDCGVAGVAGASEFSVWNVGAGSLGAGGIGSGAGGDCERGFPAAGVAGGADRSDGRDSLRIGLFQTSCDESSEFESEAGLKFALAEAGDGEGAAVVFAGEPFAGEGEMEERGAERASNVGTALAPVKTGVGEAAALGAGLGAGQ